MRIMGATNFDSENVVITLFYPKILLPIVVFVLIGLGDNEKDVNLLITMLCRIEDG